MAVYQCARLSTDHKLSHEREVTRIGRFLIDTTDRGLVFKINRLKLLELFLDADFTGG